MIAWPIKRRRVLDLEMAWREAGEGDPIVLVHGNPTSSYTWRRIVPYLEGSGRLIAPDLIGMGASDKLQRSGAETYVFGVHWRYLDAFLGDVGPRAILIAHGWGAALACDWARRHPDRVQGLAYMEGEITPLTSALMDPATVDQYKFLRSRAGELMALKTTYLLERMLFESLGARLDNADREAFLAPYADPGESRRPLLEWEREVPINGIPADTHDALAEVRLWLMESDTPKLFVKAAPGALMVGERLEAAQSARNQTEITVAAGAHPQEEAPARLGVELAKWIATLRS